MGAFAYETYYLGIRTMRRFLRVPMKSPMKTPILRLSFLILPSGPPARSGRSPPSPTRSAQWYSPSTVRCYRPCRDEPGAS